MSEANEVNPTTTGSVFKRLVSNLICWWFGCDPDYEHPCELSPNYVVPCKRCGAHDTDYADRVGDTRHAHFMSWVTYRLLRCWWPEKCPDCGKRFGRHDDCVPF